MFERIIGMKAKADEEKYNLSIKKSDDALANSGKLTPEEELKYFKNVVKNLMDDASKALANIELSSHGVETKKEISLLSHCLDFTTRLCEGEYVVCKKDERTKSNIGEEK